MSEIDPRDCQHGFANAAQTEAEWKKKYYPISATEQVKQDSSLLACTLHSIRKWQGFNESGSPSHHGGSTCALCVRVVGCHKCLPELHMCNSIDSPYSLSLGGYNPVPILSALFKAAFRLMGEAAIEGAKK